MKPLPAPRSAGSAGLITIEKGYAGKRARTWVTLTKAGQAALAEEITQLKLLISQIERNDTTPDQAHDPDGLGTHRRKRGCPPLGAMTTGAGWPPPGIKPPAADQANRALVGIWEGASHERNGGDTRQPDGGASKGGERHPRSGAALPFPFT